jgi:hypothetical protein
MIDIELKNLLKVQKALKDQPKKINLVLSRAINRAATNAKANMAKKVREQYVVKAADIKDTIKITKATSQKPVAEVRSVGKKINLTKFKTSPHEPRPKNPPKGGYKSQVKKEGGLKAVPKGFLVNVRGTLAMMQRVGKERLPIKRLMGPSVPEMIGRKNVIEWVETEAKSMLNNRIDHELKRILEAKRI